MTNSLTLRCEASAPRRVRWLPLTLVLAACLAMFAGIPVTASAEEPAEIEKAIVEATNASGEIDFSALSLDQLKKLVESLEAKQQDAQRQLEDCDGLIAQNQAHLEELEAALPVAQGVAERSVRERYKMQQHRGGVLDALVSESDINSFIAAVEYIEAASKVSVDEVVSLRAEHDSAVAEAERLAVQRDDAESLLAQVQEDLQQATAARDEAQRKADLVANAHLVPDGANWDAGEEAFVAEWAGRIDAYLQGSPMQGQGKTFAKAAWKYQVDPRFSPAISNTESGKGRVCIRPYNAWGWGAADSNPRGLAHEWSSWEEAIDAHVSGLARGYGYTISEAGAEKYCPFSWEEWYANTIAQMNKI